MRFAHTRAVLVHVSLLALLGLGVVGCGSSASSTGTAAAAAASSSPASVSVVEAGSQDLSSVDVIYFVHLLNQRGIKASFTGVSDASSGLRSVVAGQSDLFIGSLPTAILAVHSGGAAIKVVATNDQSSDYVLVAKKGVTLQNLSGKTVAIDTPGSAGQVAAQVGFRKAGANAQGVHYVTVGSSAARETAMLSGRVDIAPLHFPDALTVLATGKVKLLLNSGQKIGPYLQSGLIASDKFLQNTALSQKVVNAFIDAERWAATDRSGYIAYANANKLSGGLSAAQEASVWNFYKTINFFGVNGGTCSRYIDAFASLNQAIGQLPKPLPDRSKWLDASFAQNYLKAHHQDPNAC